MKDTINTYHLNTVSEIADMIKTIAFDTSKDEDYKPFFNAFKKEGDIRAFCRSVYDFFKEYGPAPKERQGDQNILLPSYIIREKKCDVKSLCIIYSKILQHHGINHNFKLIRYNPNSAYMYVIAYDEKGKPIHFHTDFTQPFGLGYWHNPISGQQELF